MWRLIDCGTYLWFIKKSKKYYHCVYHLDGEHKKIKVNATKYPLYSTSEKMKYAYLKTWNLDDNKCIIDRKTYKFQYRLWKNLRKTVLMKEILKQLKDSRVASS